MSRRLLQGSLILVAVVILVVEEGCGNPPLTNPSLVNHTATATPQTNNAVTAPVQTTVPAGVPDNTIKTVFLILMENHNWSDIKGSPSAPYINKTLLPMASHAEQYSNPPGNHPSEPNYLWLEAGTNFGISGDNDPAANHQSTKLHLVTLLNNAHMAWKSYQEDISGNDCPITSTGAYAPKHNPMVFFDDVTNTNDPHSASCIAHVRPYTELGTDLPNAAPESPCALDMGMKGAFLMGRDGRRVIRWVIPSQKGIFGPSDQFCQGKSLIRETAMRKRSICLSVREKFVLFLCFSS